MLGKIFLCTLLGHFNTASSPHKLHIVYSKEPNYVVKAAQPLNQSMSQCSKLKGLPVAWRGVPSHAHSLGITVVRYGIKGYKEAVYLAYNIDKENELFHTISSVYGEGPIDFGLYQTKLNCSPKLAEGGYYMIKLFALDLDTKTLPSGLDYNRYRRAIRGHIVDSDTVVFST